MMTAEEIEEYVKKEVGNALDLGRPFVELRKMGEDPKQDARFLMIMFDCFPDESQDTSFSAIVVLGKRWRVSIVEDNIRLDQDNKEYTRRKMTAKQYKEWWAAELALRGIQMHVPEGQTPLVRPSQSPLEESED